MLTQTQMTELWHQGLQLYNSLVSQYEAVIGGLIPYWIMDQVSAFVDIQIAHIIFRHGPKPGRHEAEAEAFSKLEAEAEAFTDFSLEAEAEALVTKPKPKPKPGYLYSTNMSKLW